MKATDYARANGAYQSDTEGYVGYWWLRSPLYYDRYCARGIYYDGSDSNRSVFDYNVWVVPALTVTE